MNDIKRRTFLKALGTAGVAALISPDFVHTMYAAPRASDPDAMLRNLLDAAKQAGAEYAEARYVFLRNQSIQTRRDALYSITDTESGGFSLRAYKGGNWGFAAQGTVESVDPTVLARRACGMAEALGAYQRAPLVTADRISKAMAPWATPLARDPFSIELKEKLDFLLDLSTRPLSKPEIAYSVANLFAVKRESSYANSLGGAVEQTQLSIYPNFAVTMFDATTRRIDSRSTALEARSGGFEICTGHDFHAEIDAAMAEVLEYSKAPKLETGEYDLVIDPGHLWRILHDSLATSFDTQSLLGLEGTNPQLVPYAISDLGKKLFDAPAMNIDYDNTLPGGLATYGWDDAGHPASHGRLLQEGVLTSLPRSDELEFEAGGNVAVSTRAAGWQTPPRFAMPNLVLRGASNGKSLEDLIADTERGLLLVGRGKPNISLNRKWMQGASQIAWLIENGKRTHMVRDYQYSASIPYFWNVLRDVGGDAERIVAGDLFPQSTNPMWETPFSIAVPPARFHGVSVVADEGGNK